MYVFGIGNPEYIFFISIGKSVRKNMFQKYFRKNMFQKYFRKNMFQKYFRKNNLEVIF